MKRRWIGVVAAFALAGLGTFMIVRYVSGAEARALEGQEAIEVLVVSDEVMAGTPAASIGNSVAIELVPAKVQVPGSVGDLAELGDQVTAVDLVPGEQVTTARFVDVEEFEAAEELDIPDDLVEVTVSLSPERAVGGALQPGDEVSVFASFDPFDLEGAILESEVEAPNAQQTDASQGDAPEGDGASSDEQDDSEAEGLSTPNSTHIIIHKVLVTNVQVETLPTEQAEDDENGESQGPELAPTGNLLVTLGIDPADGERLVFTAEFGFIWLGSAGENSSVDDTRVQTRDSVYYDLSDGRTR